MLLVNFGGPRSLQEIRPFLTALLTDRDTVRTTLPFPFHDLLFRQIAKKRAKKVTQEYADMGGCSPLYEDTEAVKRALETTLSFPIITYHRYLPSTHKSTVAAIEECAQEEIIVFPLYPQFSYATTGSAARQLLSMLTKKSEQKLRWIKSYGNHVDFAALFVGRIRKKIAELQVHEENVILLFTAHGLPKRFIEEGDPYLWECKQSFNIISSNFHKALSLLAFQSQFGRAEWISPSTASLCTQIHQYSQNKSHVLFIPLSFTSDHLETLIEIERQYKPIIEGKGLVAVRLAAFNRDEDWIAVIKKISSNFTPITTRMLVRGK